MIAAMMLAAIGWSLFLVTYAHTHAIGARGLFPNGATYLDLTNYLGLFDVFRTRAFFQTAAPSLHRSRFAYPPAATVPYALLYGSHRFKFTYTLLTLSLWIGLLAIAGAAFWRASRSGLALVVSVLTFVLLAYPALFLFERANIEIFLWALLVAGPLLYRSGRYHLAAVCFGFAAAMKLYPILLLGLFLGEKRQWKALGTGLGVGVLVTLAALWWTAPGFIWFGARGYLEGITGFQNKYAGSLDAGPTAFDHSLFSLLKRLALSTGHAPDLLIKPYYLVCGLLAVVTFLTCVRKKPFVNRFTFLVLLTILLPPVSFEYTLVHLYLPAALILLLFLRDRDWSPDHRRSALLALGCLFALMLPIDLLGHEVSYAGQIQVVPLLLLGIEAARQPWSDASDVIDRNASDTRDVTPAGLRSL